MKSIKMSFALIMIAVQCISAQNYERYKRLTDTTVFSKELGYDKNITVTVPIEWQSDISKTFPLIVVFDQQNQRSHGFILQTIDYLTSNEQMPSCIVISIESLQKYRYLETLYKASDEKGLASENEKFLFEELIPLAEKKYKASDYRMFIGHSRYGYFTTALLTSRTKDIHAVISLSPFFVQKNVNLTDSLKQMMHNNIEHPIYYRFGIGNDYPEDFYKMDHVVKNLNHPMLNAKGYLFKEADHNVTPGLTIGIALYEIFEKWSEIQSVYFSNDQYELEIIEDLEKDIVQSYGSPLSFSLGILNGKGWYFYGIEEYEKAIEAWEILMTHYPNFSEGLLYIIDAQIKLGQEPSDTKRRFLQSIEASKLYNENEKQELMEMYEEIK